MTYDMRPLNVDDTRYKRLIEGVEVDTFDKDLVSALKKLKRDFYDGNCANGIVYDYDYGIAFAMTEDAVMNETDFEITVVDQSMQIKDYLRLVEHEIDKGAFCA